jgi:hypothetical protein
MKRDSYGDITLSRATWRDVSAKIKKTKKIYNKQDNYATIENLKASNVRDGL